MAIATSSAISLTHWDQETHICTSQLIHHRYSEPSHYLNQYWSTVNWILGNKIQWNLNQSTAVFFQRYAFENIVCKMAIISSRPQCVDRWNYSIIVLHCCRPEVTIPSSQAIWGDRNGGSAPLFRQRITIDSIVSKAVHSRGPHRSGQLCVMGYELYLAAVPCVGYAHQVMTVTGCMCVQFPWVHKLIH